MSDNIKVNVTYGVVRMPEILHKEKNGNIVAYTIGDNGEHEELSAMGWDSGEPMTMSQFSQMKFGLPVTFDKPKLIDRLKKLFH